MGTSIGRIEQEYILKALEDGNLEININCEQKQARAIILEFEAEEYIELFSKDRMLSNFQEGDRVCCFFSYFGSIMAFYSKILSCSDEKAKIEYPELCLRNLQRKNQRIKPPKGLGLRFSIKDFPVELNYPKTNKYISINDFKKDDKINYANVKDLADNYHKILNTKCDESHIIFFNNRKPESLEEEMIIKEAGIFYISSIHEAMDIPKSTLELPIIDNEKIDMAEINVIISNMKRQNVYSVVYCPIFYQEYIIGYILLKNITKRPIAVETLEYVYRFTKILVLLLLENNYFNKNTKKNKTFFARIVNISETGLLFEHPSKKLKEVLQIYTDLNLELLVKEKLITIPSRIMRGFSTENENFYGVRFLDFSQEDFQHLFKFIYGHEYTEQDKLWEGGALPPTLEQ